MKALPQLRDAFTAWTAAILRASPALVRRPEYHLRCLTVRSCNIGSCSNRHELQCARPRAAWRRWLDERVGDTVGLRTRGEICVSLSTRVEVVQQKECSHGWCCRIRRLSPTARCSSMNFTRGYTWTSGSSGHASRRSCGVRTGAALAYPDRVGTTATGAMSGTCFAMERAPSL